MNTKKIQGIATLLALATLLLLAGGDSASANEVSGVCGVYPADQGAYVAVELELPAGQSLAGLSWFNNDGQQPFEGVVLLEATEGSAPDLSGGALVLGEIWGLSSDWSQLTLEQPVNSSTGWIHAVFVVPSGGSYATEGAFGGPAIGYFVEGAGQAAYVSVDALDWSPVHRDYGLAVEPVLGSGSGKTGGQLLSKLPPWVGAPKPEVEEAKDRAEPPKTALMAPRPNPFNPRTEVRFSLEREGLVQVVVYDVRGRRVRTLASGSLAAGLHALTWQGIDDRGGSVASGVYFLKMEFGGQVMTRRMTLVR